MKRKLKLLALLSWYKGLQQEQAKIRVINCKINLEKLLNEKINLINQRKQTYNLLEKKKLLSSEEIKYFLFQNEKNLKFQELLDKKINIQKKELENLLMSLEKTYKERKTIEILRNKTQQLWFLENLRKFYKEMDDLTIIRKGRKYV